MTTRRDFVIGMAGLSPLFAARAAAQTGWDQGRLVHLLPTVSHDRRRNDAGKVEFRLHDILPSPISYWGHVCWAHYISQAAQPNSILQPAFG